MKQALSDFIRMIFGIPSDQDITNKEIILTAGALLFITVMLTLINIG